MQPWRYWESERNECFVFHSINVCIYLYILFTFVWFFFKLSPRILKARRSAGNFASRTPKVLRAKRTKPDLVINCKPTIMTPIWLMLGQVRFEMATRSGLKRKAETGKKIRQQRNSSYDFRSLFFRRAREISDRLLCGSNNNNNNNTRPSRKPHAQLKTIFSRKAVTCRVSVTQTRLCPSTIETAGYDGMRCWAISCKVEKMFEWLMVYFETIAIEFTN